MDRLDHFYHGSASTVPVGGTMLPAAKLEPRYQNWHLKNAGDSLSRDHVSMNKGDEHTAWRFADYASERTGDRAAVYEVQPSSDVKMGLHNSEHPEYRPGIGDFQEHISSTAKVLKRHDIMPGHQGTFPLNWKQFAADPEAEVNHPSNENVERYIHGDGPMKARQAASRAARYIKDPIPPVEPPQKETLF